MPKKFQSENTKSVVARARKAEKAAAEKAAKDKAAEDALWKEDDKQICKKIQRKEDKERKKQAEAQKKLELKLLEEKEAEEIAPKILPQKLTLYQLQKQKENERLESEKSKETQSIIEAPITENLNRLEGEIISASGIDAAVSALSMNELGSDKQPGKRLAAAFREFEAEKMPQIKKENPTLRHSQLTQILRKQWQRSPQNPLNQRID